MPDKTLIHFKRETPEAEGVTMARLNFNPHDIWFGVYWKHVQCENCARKHLNIWLTIIPCFPVHIVLRGSR